MDGPRMHAAVLHGIGQVPRYEEFAVPVAGEGEALVTVAAAALKPFDLAWARGAHPAGPTAFPQIVGADGVGRLEDGTRVAFFGPRPPYGGMAEVALVREGLWFGVPDGVDDVTAAAVLNPGGAAWKALFIEGGLEPGRAVLILGATGISGRIAAQLACRHGARVVVAGRNQQVLDDLVAAGASAAIRVDRPRADLIEAILASAPYDLVVDYLWGAPGEAVLAALIRPEAHGTGAGRTRYILVGMAAGEVAGVPAMALRHPRLELVGSGVRGPASLESAAAGYARVLEHVVAGEVTVAVDAVPLAEVERAWVLAGDRRTVLIP
jgi:NADPH:quinone reductase-like Zn-dependent oxidoreductase